MCGEDGKMFKKKRVSQVKNVTMERYTNDSNNTVIDI
jgi:hypothetical protein